MSKRAMVLPVVALAVLGVTLASWAQDRHGGRQENAGNEGQEVEVTLEQVPAAVRETILREAGGAKITEIERETRNGKTVYEAEFMLDGSEVEIKIAPDGTLLGRSVERENDDDDDLTLEQLPAPVQAALRKLAGTAEFTELGREREHGTTVYEAEWIAGGVEHEAELTADGTVIETEETIRVDQAPDIVRQAIETHFGAGAKVVVEKKMIVLYEIEGRVDGRPKEILVHPTAGVRPDPEDDSDDDDDEDEDDDDHEDDDE